MRVDLFDFELPPERIALRPARPRDAARMLVVRGEGPFEDRGVGELPSMLEPGDVIVFNDTRVIPAQLEGRRGEARIGVTLHKRVDLRRWQAFIRNAKRVKEGDRLEFPAGVSAIAELRHEDGSFTLAFAGEEPVEVLLERAGRMPLPPYIAGKRETDEEDREDYQTIFAREDGAVAAPTASLHFTPELLSRCEANGIAREHVTLHVGIGTFRPVSTDNLDDHVMHSERCILTADAADRLNQVRTAGGRIVAIGTTSVRTLESAEAATGQLTAYSGDTDIFIRPPYTFQAVDALLTNFHLPKSTLLMLVSALADVELIQQAYTTAIAERYRFYSYGDAMLIL